MSGYYRVQSQPVKFSIFSINTKHKQAKFIYIYHSNIPFAFDFGTYSSPFYILLKMYGSSKIVEAPSLSEFSLTMGVGENRFLFISKGVIT